MKRPLPAIIPALASPFNFVYSKKDLDTHGYKWHMRNVNGTGAFIFVQEQPGAFIEGKQNPNFYIKGRALSRRLQSDPGAEDVGPPAGHPRQPRRRPSSAASRRRRRDELVKAIGNGSRCAGKSTGTSCSASSPNEKKKELQDPACARR